ncbi:hypothetical protein A4X09_0g7226 [Tilletia walkeri]|uniref:Uncharacterized protein n=1 Tax=Tilletia walkeri TaxID=117179 RepID=A0A8X7T172_9BASI|nr:hypothetical protein A4X09_0g7226 [Tilletia walkeri]
MSNANIDPLELCAALRCLDRLVAEQRPTVEQAIRQQFDADEQAAQAQAAQEAEEEAARQESERLAVQADETRRTEVLRAQETHLAAAKNLVDLAKAHSPLVEPKDEAKQVTQDKSLANGLDMLVAVPSQKVPTRSGPAITSTCGILEPRAWPWPQSPNSLGTPPSRWEETEPSRSRTQLSAFARTAISP